MDVEFQVHEYKYFIHSRNNNYLATLVYFVKEISKHFTVLLFSIKLTDLQNYLKCQKNYFQLLLMNHIILTKLMAYRF